MANEFLVSVADVIGRDTSTGNVLFRGKANLNSSFTMTTQKTEVRGGINNPLLYTYYHDRAVEVKIESATFDKSLWALNAGTTVVNDTVTVVKTESVTLSSGSGTLTETPTSNVGVIFDSGAIQTVTPVGTDIYVSGGGSQSVTAVYDYSETLVDQVVGYTVNPPTGVELIMTSEIRNASGTKVYDLQIDIPAFNISGNYTLALNANGVSTQSFDGTAAETTHADGNYYYKVNWIPATSAVPPVTAIAAIPTTLSFSAATAPDTGQITVMGIRGGTYANITLTTASSYVRTSGCSTITVGTGTGVVTATSAVNAGDTALITATYYDATSGSLTDTVNVSVTS